MIVRHHMADIGRELAQARQREALSLQDLARRTKISQPILEAIERDDFKNIPGGLYTRGLLRAYAREVGCDPEDIVRRFRESPEAGSLEHELTLAEIAHAAERPKPGVTRRVSPDTTDSDRRRVIGQLGLIAFAIVIGGVAYAAFGGAFRPLMRRSTESTAAAPASAAPPVQSPSAPNVAPSTPAPTPVQTPAPTHDDPAPGTPTPAPQPRQTLPPEEQQAAAAAVETSGVGSPVATPAAEHGNTSLRLEIQATGPCWLTGTADGERIIYQLLSAGDRTQIDANEDIVLRVGDPGTFALTINGATARSLGTAGEPVTVHLTRQNYREFLSQ
ncbi:MAG TPA: RodZ domain-containing protein [Vicinamibacterales bacterium]|nr:RodZ domain-containing protein [Vicinamibacterales bacterium]